MKFIVHLEAWETTQYILVQEIQADERGVRSVPVSLPGGGEAPVNAAHLQALPYTPSRSGNHPEYLINLKKD